MNTSPMHKSTYIYTQINTHTHTHTHNVTTCRWECNRLSENENLKHTHEYNFDDNDDHITSVGSYILTRVHAETNHETWR